MSSMLRLLLLLLSLREQIPPDRLKGIYRMLMMIIRWNYSHLSSVVLARSFVRSLGCCTCAHQVLYRRDPL